MALRHSGENLPKQLVQFCAVRTTKEKTENIKNCL